MEKYQTIKEIGKGNYGKAVLVKNLEDKNLYVIKVIIIIILEHRYFKFQQGTTR
jgi:hypothetical protein